MRSRILTAASLIFYVAAAATVLTRPPAAMQPPVPALVSGLLAGSDLGYNPFGFEFEPFRRVLPREGAVSFLMDTPFGPYARDIEKLHTAQYYLAPLLVNSEPVEKAAIVYCSDIPTADRRMAQTGYRLVLPMAPGKAVAAKNP